MDKQEATRDEEKKRIGFVKEAREARDSGTIRLDWQAGETRARETEVHR